MPERCLETKKSQVELVVGCIFGIVVFSLVIVELVELGKNEQVQGFWGISQHSATLNPNKIYEVFPRMAVCPSPTQNGLSSILSLSCVFTSSGTKLQVESRQIAWKVNGNELFCYDINSNGEAVVSQISDTMECSVNATSNIAVEFIAQGQFPSLSWLNWTMVNSMTRTGLGISHHQYIFLGKADTVDFYHVDTNQIIYPIIKSENFSIIFDVQFENYFLRQFLQEPKEGESFLAVLGIAGGYVAMAYFISKVFSCIILTIFQLDRKPEWILRDNL